VGEATLKTQLISDLDDARPYLGAWDELAVDSAKPYCAPAWMRSWWLHASPVGSVLRLMLIFDGGELVGVLPFFADRSTGVLDRYRVLGAGCSSRVDLLARRGMETRVLSAWASTLKNADPEPDVVMFEGIPSDSPWPALLAEEWPGRSASLIRRFDQPAPSVRLQDRTYDEWFSSKSRNFRQSMRRSLRSFQREGGSFRLVSNPDELERSLRAFSDLHHRRWNWRGGSGVLNERIERMLAAVGEQLVGGGRLRLWTMEVRGQVVSSHLFLSAGMETAYWLGGFDDDWARLHPSALTILTAIEHAFSAGDRRLDLGTGAQEYKLRFSDEADDILWTMVVPAGPRSMIARTQLLPQRVRLTVARRLPPGIKRSIRRVRRRAARPRSRGAGSARRS
jgi:CelD/BcsL family acetyltransferase involved in cellulose biosynthesis